MTPRSIFSFGLATLLLAAAGCRSTPATTPATIVDMNNGPDPAAVNFAAAGSAIQPATGAAPQVSKTRVLGQRAVAPAQQSGESYPAQQYDPNQNYDPQDEYDGYDESQVDAGQQALYADDAPPPLPQYEQPELTVANDQWTPGYWNYAQQGYYWVPGAWVAPPYQGALWTPPYWGYEGRRYHFHRGFWARHIGFYGGVPYGHGYGGSGYEGGYWNGASFFYNRAVQRVNVVNVRNVYQRNVTVINNNVTRVSYNGGPGGWRVQPRPAELAVYRERRTPPMQTQVQRVRNAQSDQQQFFSANRGRPAIAVLTQHAEADRTPQPALRQIDTTRRGFGQRPGQNDQQVRQQAQQQNVLRQQEAVQQNQQRQQQLQQRQQLTAARAAATNNAARQQNLENHQVQQQQRAQQLQQNAQRLQQQGQRQEQVQQQQQVRQQQQAERQQQQVQRQQAENTHQQQQAERQQQNVQRQQQNLQRQQQNVQRQQAPPPQQPQQLHQPRQQQQRPGGGGGHPGQQPKGEHGPGHP